MEENDRTTQYVKINQYIKSCSDPMQLAALRETVLAYHMAKEPDSAELLANYIEKEHDLEKLLAQPKLTKEIALNRLSDIKNNSSYSEEAHGMEDDLYRWFVQCISLGHYAKEEAEDIAKIVIQSREIKFPRHCA